MALTEKQQSFLRRIDRISSDKKIHLRKSIGMPLQVGTYPWQAFLSLDPPFHSEEERQVYYFVACVKASQKEGDKLSVGECLTKAKRLRGNSDTFENNFLSLIKSPLDRYGNFEKRLLSLFSKEVMLLIDTEDLLYDLLHWNHGKKFVQEKWGRALYCPLTEEYTENE